LKAAVAASPYGYEKIAQAIQPMVKEHRVTYDVLNNIANGRRHPDPEIMRAVGRFLGLPSNWPDVQSPLSVTGTPMKEIKIVGSAAAGAEAYNVDPDQHTVFVPQTLANLGGLGWVIEGDSMMPDLEPGMLAIFKEHREPRPGLTFLVQNEEGGLRVKTLEWRNDAWHLVSTNPQFAPEHIGSHALLGYLIGWYRVQGLRETLDSDPNGLRLRSW
jgi:SOS-response transcriptional repressor LexA